MKGDTVTMTVREPERRRHQFVLTMEQPHGQDRSRPNGFSDGGGRAARVGRAGARRDRDHGGHTLGGRHLAPDGRTRNQSALRALARQPLLAAFRYQRRPGESRRLALDVKRFPDAAVLSAIAESAVATTLVTSEGRMLTEMTLRFATARSRS